MSVNVLSELLANDVADAGGDQGQPAPISSTLPGQSDDVGAG